MTSSKNFPRIRTVLTSIVSSTLEAVLDGKAAAARISHCSLSCEEIAHMCRVQLEGRTLFRPKDGRAALMMKNVDDIVFIRVN